MRFVAFYFALLSVLGLVAGAQDPSNAAVEGKVQYLFKIFGNVNAAEIMP